MTAQNSSLYEPPHTQDTQSGAPKSHVVRNLSLGCGGILFLGLLAIGSCVMLTKTIGDKDLASVVDSYFAKADQGDFHGVYADSAEAMRKVQSEDDFIAFDRGVHQRLGKLESKTSLQTQTGFGTGGGWALSVYKCHFEKGDASVRFRFQKEGGEWKIVGVNYDSPVINDAVRASLNAPPPPAVPSGDPR